MLMATRAKMALEQDQRQLRRRLAQLTADSYRDVTGAPGSSGFRPSSRSPTSSESAASTSSSYSPSPSDCGESMNPLLFIAVIVYTLIYIIQYRARNESWNCFCSVLHQGCFGPRPHLARIVLVFPADAYLTSSSVVVC